MRVSKQLSVPGPTKIGKKARTRYRENQLFRSPVILGLTLLLPLTLDFDADLLIYGPCFDSPLDTRLESRILPLTLRESAFMPHKSNDVVQSI